MEPSHTRGRAKTATGAAVDGEQRILLNKIRRFHPFRLIVRRLRYAAGRFLRQSGKQSENNCKK